MSSNNYVYLLLFLLPTTGITAPLPETGSFWQCTIQDKAHKTWSAKSPYQKVAIILAFENCKKESADPKSCATSATNCEGFYLGMSTNPMWQCTALDLTAAFWTSNFYTNREDAALAAKDFCKQKSTVPESCYINLVTCRNMNEGAQF